MSIVTDVTDAAAYCETKVRDISLSFYIIGPNIYVMHGKSIKLDWGYI